MDKYKKEELIQIYEKLERIKKKLQTRLNELNETDDKNKDK